MIYNNHTPTIDKPCIRKCTLDEHDVCLGCFRTLEDMRKWHKSSQDEKIKMLALATLRKETRVIQHKP